MAELEMQEHRTRQTVLVAEDEDLLAKAIAATLDLEGLQTVIAHDGEEALALTRTLQPNLVLLDVMMPGRSGIEVCATLKTDPQTASIPVILLTARADKQDRTLGFAAGADGYVIKPFSPVRLIDMVKEVLAGSESIETIPFQTGLSAMPTDQLVVYARDLKELFERERAERQALEEAQRRLEELDRLKAEFLGGVTHELLSPFAAIGLEMEILQRRSEHCAPELGDSLHELMSQIAGLHRLVGGVVKFAELVGKRRDPQPGYIALAQVIPYAVQAVAMLAQAREVDFRVLVPSDLPTVHADPELLGEAVFQIAHNAVKFNLPGGRAWVKAFEAEGWVVIEVTDTGVGLTPEQIALLEQPFEQNANALRRGQGGLGIGWAFVRYVAEVHGGWVRVESPGPDQGSTFALALAPAAAEQGPGASSGTGVGD